jgi:hypothetical protein
LGLGWVETVTDVKVSIAPPKRFASLCHERVFFQHLANGCSNIPGYTLSTFSRIACIKTDNVVTKPERFESAPETKVTGDS